MKKFEQERSEIYIYDLAMAAGHRREGVATAMIEKPRDISAERSAYVIFVQADTGIEDEGFTLAPQKSVRQYMAEAISAVTDWWLSQPEIFRVSAVCDMENVASARALEKAGFKREGELSRWIMLPNRSTEPRDCYIYGRVR